MKEKKISPSLLPFLCACPCFISAGKATPEAQRGTMIHRAISEVWEARQGRTLFPAEDILENLNERDRAAVEYALEIMAYYGQDKQVYTTGDHVKAKAALPELADGIMDACAPYAYKDGGLTFEFKTGKRHLIYTGQSTAYEYACMKKYGAKKWNTVLVWVDEKTHEHGWSRLGYTPEDLDYVSNDPVYRLRYILDQPKTPRGGIQCHLCGVKDCPKRIKE